MGAMETARNALNQHSSSHNYSVGPLRAVAAMAKRLLAQADIVVVSLDSAMRRTSLLGRREKGMRRGRE